MHSTSLSAEERSSLDALAADLRRVFGARLQAFAAYGLKAPSAEPRALHTIALVERLAFGDLTACAPLAAGWQRRGLSVPLVLEREEFLRTLLGGSRRSEASPQGQFRKVVESPHSL